MVERYLNDTISAQKKWVEENLLEANLLNPNQPR
jgi:hypothetical protein